MAKSLSSSPAVNQTTTDTTEVDPIVKITVFSLQCAWCLEEQGIEQGEGSHGICNPHADVLLQAHKARRAA